MVFTVSTEETAVVPDNVIGVVEKAQLVAVGSPEEQLNETLELYVGSGVTVTV